MEWFSREKVGNDTNSGGSTKTHFLKFAKSVFKGKENVKMSTSKFLKTYLDEKELAHFVFGLGEVDGEKKLFIQFTQLEGDGYPLKNANNKHKTNVSVNKIITSFREAGLELPLIRLQLEEVNEETKAKLEMVEVEHLFEVVIPKVEETIGETKEEVKDEPKAKDEPKNAKAKEEAKTDAKSTAKNKK